MTPNPEWDEVTLDGVNWNLEWVRKQGRDNFLALAFLQGFYDLYSEEDRLTLLSKVYEYASGFSSKG